MLSKLRHEAFYLVYKAIGVWPDKAAKWLAWKLPRRVTLWSYIRVMAHATSGPHGNRHPEEVTYSMAYDAWEKGEHPTLQRAG